MDLFDEAMELFATFERKRVRYAVAGALALAVHGVPRATTDIDVLVEAEALAEAMAAARERGFSLEALPMRFSDGMEVQRVSKLDGPEVLTLDFLLVNVSLEPVFRDRVAIETERGPIWTVSRDGLVRMKTWANRPQDVADIQRLRDLDR